MRRIFADTSYYVALLREGDRYHRPATRFAATYKGITVTTQYIVLELGNIFARSTSRHRLLELLNTIEASNYDEVLSTSSALYDSGLELFRSRPDKNWSLTDCISFVAMDSLGVEEALTTDHHFEQAGYRSLLLEIDR
jgi:hypothetical protein